MRYIKVILADGDEALDIHSMHALTHDEYASYLEHELFFVDHHDILRANIGQYPIACTKDQVDGLIEYLIKIQQRLAD